MTRLLCTCTIVAAVMGIRIQSAREKGWNSCLKRQKRFSNNAADATVLKLIRRRWAVA